MRTAAFLSPAPLVCRPHHPFTSSYVSRPCLSRPSPVSRHAAPSTTCVIRSLGLSPDPPDLHRARNAASSSLSLPCLPPTLWPKLSRVLRRALPLLVVAAPFALLLPAPVCASALSSLTRSADPQAFVPALTAAFVLVLASEIGDKTFFISALLSMKYSRWLVLVGTMAALGAMTLISVAIGQVFHALPASLNSSIPFDDYAAVALLLWFGVQNVRDALRMRADEDEELQDAKDVVAGTKEGGEGGKGATGGARVVAETGSLIFLAEWGDKSMLATVALAAAKNPWGVIVGGVSGHFVASVIAVVGGSFLGKYISERNARLLGGVLFFVFALLTILGLY